MIRNVRYTVHEERYFDCPYCGGLVSDNGTASNVESDKINYGNVLKCPHCNKSVRIEGED